MESDSPCRHEADAPSAFLLLTSTTTVCHVLRYSCTAGFGYRTPCQRIEGNTSRHVTDSSLCDRAM